MGPVPEGTNLLPSLEADADAGNALERCLSGQATLTDLTRDYVLFQPDLLYVAAGLRIDLVQEYANLLGEELQAGLIRHDRPFLGGLGEEMDRRLYFCARPQWEGLRRHLTKAGVVDQDRGLVWWAIECRSRAVDLPALDRCECLPDPIPSVEIVWYGAAGNGATVGFRQDETLHTASVLRVIVLPPQPPLVSRAAAVLAGQSRPYVRGDPFYEGQQAGTWGAGVFDLFNLRGQPCCGRDGP